MKDIYGSTSEEVKMIKAIQRKMGILDNGWIGTDTFSSIAETLGADCFPLAVKMYDCPTVIAKSCEPFDPDGPIRNFAYTMSGSFTWPSGVNPCSILVNRGKVLCEYACHYWQDGKPESVLYQTTDGKLHVKRVMSIAQLPSNLIFAVGGMGLLDNYDPDAEGFCGNQAGVLRKTGHTVLAYKNGYLYSVCFPNHTSQQINQICRDKFKFEGAIQLDGGSVYFYNFPGMTRGINTICGYAIRFI